MVEGVFLRINRCTMKQYFLKHSMPYFFLIALMATSCSTGYKKEGGGWVWVTRDEMYGKRSLSLILDDPKSFKVLSNNDYGKDTKRVYYQGGVIFGADPASFQLINNEGYAKDKHAVFLERSKIIHANPSSFEYLTYPYSRDANHLFCGTLPVMIDTSEISSFKVTNTDKLMVNMRGTILKSHFVEMNPEYAWLDTIDQKWIMVGDWGTGETNRFTIKGFSVKPK
jgi:hypothetical protein